MNGAGRWLIHVDRVVVRGAGTRNLEAGEVRGSVVTAAREAMRRSALPAGRAIYESIAIEDSRLASGGRDGLARAVAQGIARVASGGQGRG
jgi:hypothetical protein